MRRLLTLLLLMTVNGAALASKDDRMQTVCAGRFELQIPEGARLTQFAVTRDGVSLGSSRTSSLTALKAEWEKESTTLRIRRHAKAGNALIESKAIDANTFILSWYDSHASLRLARVRLYFFADRHSYVLEQTGTNETRVARGEELQAMTRRLLPQPSGAGLCFDGGFLLAPDDAGAENVQLGIELVGKPDVRLNLDTNTNNGELPDRVTARLANSGLEQEPAFAQVQKLFDGSRTVNGISGEAAGYKVPTSATTLAHRMVFQSLGIAQPDVLKPEITFTLKSGEQREDASYPQPSLSDEEARRLFDDLVGSLKIRPHQ